MHQPFNSSLVVTPNTAKSSNTLIKRTAMSVALGVALLSMVGCETTQTQRDTGKGGLLGALGGAVLGGIIDGKDGAEKGALIGAAAGAIGGHIWSTKMQEQKAAMEKATAGTGIKVIKTDDNRLKLDIPSDVSFASGRSNVSPEFGRVLVAFADGLKTNPAALVTIEGHTDSVGSEASNLSLSKDRALSTRDYLAANGVAIGRITTNGYGETRPIADNATAAGKAQNRRVEIFMAEPAPKQ
jgi:outer membrane protein OmpA-like peptidoglycan-associated protein